MPSQFETAFAAGAPSTLYAAFGLPATYTAPDKTVTTLGVDGNPLTIRIHRNEARQMDRTVRASGEMQTGEIMVMQAQLPQIVRDGRFTVEGLEVWTVETKPVLKNGEYVCTVTRSGVERLMPMRAKE